jgi:hypothetical protein
MAVQQDTDLLTIAEAAELLKVSRVTIQRWLNQAHGRPQFLDPTQRGDREHAVGAAAHASRSPGNSPDSRGDRAAARRDHRS